MLYHITKLKYLDSILKEGLKINTGNNGITVSHGVKRKNDVINKWKQRNHPCQPIFLTDDYEYIIERMLTPQWIKGNKAVILIVDLEPKDNYSLGWYQDTENGPIPKELRYYDNIEPNRIKVHKMYSLEEIKKENAQPNNMIIPKMVSMAELVDAPNCGLG